MNEVLSTGEPCSSADLSTAPRVILAGPEPLIESLHWRDAATNTPETGITVLAWTGDAQEPFECAYRSCGAWISAATGGDLEGVKFWALPQGPLA